MTSGGKCAPLKLIAIVVLPHDVPLVMEEDHTAKGLKRKLATKPVPAHGQVGRVDLEEEAGLDNGVIFLAHHLGDRLQEGLFVLIVLIDHILGQGARRDRGEERLGGLGLDGLQCRLQILDIRLHCGPVLPPQRSDAHRAAGVQGTAFRRLEVWELRLVARDARR
jgi:hypothetical protein